MRTCSYYVRWLCHVHEHQAMCQGFATPSHTLHAEFSIDDTVDLRVWRTMTNFAELLNS